MPSPKKDPSKKLSRYERVKEILDKASEGAKVSYQGYYYFWTLPLNEFLDLKLFGYRMIAPAGPEEPDLLPASSAQEAVTPPSAADDHVKSGEKEEKAGGCCGGGGGGGNAPSSPGVSRLRRAPRGGGRGAGGGSEAGEGAPIASLAAGQSRSEQSWLIKALRGDFPFDGSEFPRFLWPGDESHIVADSEIQYIADWIDDGCPETDEGAVASKDETPGTGISVREPGVAAAQDGVFPEGPGGLKLRLNALCLTWAQQEAIRDAVRHLKSLNEFPNDSRNFNSWGQMHGDHCQHGWEQFLTWHRIYLFEFERTLQQVVPGLTLPYWEWTNKTLNQGKIPKDKQSGIIPQFWRCWIDDSALNALKPNVSGATYDKLKKIESDGKAAERTYNSAWEMFVQAGLGRKEYLADGQKVTNQLIQVNPVWHPLRYPGMYYEQVDPAPTNPPLWSDLYKTDSKGDPILSASTLGDTFHHHYPLASDIEQIMTIGNWPDFGGGPTANASFGALSQNPHNTGHIWLGGANPYFDVSIIEPIDTLGPLPVQAQPQYGDMFEDLLAGYDPMFWGHHSNVDRLFTRWQTLHPGVNPEDLDDTLLPFGYNVSQALSADKLGYSYAAASRVMPSTMDHEFRKLKTPEIDVGQTVLDCHTRATVSFHQVKRSIKSYYVRVFLNLPNADANTPTRDNDHFVGQFARFGHGQCIGGPGHCDPPPRQRDHFYRRQRDHNEHHCYNLDATETVKRLMAKGEKQFHVNVVTVDPSGRETEGLRMEAISLNFCD